MMDTIKTGREGENFAAAFLEKKGFVILERNYRFKRSEIDLIVCKSDWLVFVEVKTRRSIAFGHPEEAVGENKVEKILEGAHHYLFENDWQGHVRYDIVSVTLTGGVPKIVHFEDAFY